MDLIVQMRDGGLSWNAIASQLMRKRIRRGQFDWHPETIRRAYLTELKLREAERKGKTQRCSVCGQYKPLNKEHFHRNAALPDGFHQTLSSVPQPEAKTARQEAQKKRRTATVDKFQRAAKTSSQPRLASALIAEQVGGSDQLAQDVVDVYEEAKPGGRRRISICRP